MTEVHTVVHEGLLTKDQEKTYVYLPFDVPEGAARIEVTCSYEGRIHSDPEIVGGNTLDLGVFDERGTQFLESGFRGWSGSVRDGFYITETEATPGYLSGPLKPGTWHVLLGLYKIADTGCRYHVEAAVHSSPGWYSPARIPAPVSRLPASTPPGTFAPWLRGEMHCHTVHSDGGSSPEDVVALARGRGLDFLAITDHNTISSHRKLREIADPGLILILGVECTTFRGHFNVWGTGIFADFRVTRPEEMEAAICSARDAGALTSCNHPFPLGPNWEYPEVTSCDCVEVWNGPWTPRQQRSLVLWESRLAAGQHVPAVGGSDWHRVEEMAQEPPRAPGTPTLWAYVPAEPSASSILDAIAAGHVRLSAGPEGPHLDLQAGARYVAKIGDSIQVPEAGRLRVRARCAGGKGGALRLLDEHGALLDTVLQSDEESVESELDVGRSLYVRAELRGDGESLLALTNPIYLRPGQL